MNGAERRQALLVALREPPHHRSEALARRLGCSTRTVCRDLQSLIRAGAPVIVTPNHAYLLDDGYLLPPQSFTTDEAMILLLGADLMAQNFDAQYRAAAQSALQKLSGILPATVRADVRALRDSIPMTDDGRTRPDDAARLRVLRRAIIARNTIRFHYRSRSDAPAPRQPHFREADPYALALTGGAWHLAGWCHLRRAVRFFRLDRMDNLTVLDDTFARPESFQMLARDLFEPGSFDVRLLFDRASSSWVCESLPFYTTAAEETPDGLLVSLHIRRESDIVPWLLGWGGRVRILEPEHLRRTLAAEASAILRRLNGGEPDPQTTSHLDTTG